MNKVATAVQLRFDVKKTGVMSDESKGRLLKIAGKRVTNDGILVIEAKRYRSQEKNKEDAIGRLVKLVEKAEINPEARKPTKPNIASQTKRIETKKRRGELKQNRKSPVNWE